MTYVGIDPSLSGTAIAIIDDTGGLRVERFATEPAAGHAATVRRLNRIERWLCGRLEDLGRIDLQVAIEGPAFMSQNGKAHERAGLWWRLYTRAALYADPAPFVIPPKTLKKYATGKGNADKDSVLLAVSRRYPGWAGSSNDEADALVLAAIMARYDGHPIEKTLPAIHIEALRCITPEPEEN